MGESLTHRWAEWFSASEMYFDVSDFSLSKYILNDFSLNDNKPAIILFHEDSWKWFVHHPGGACFRCRRPYRRPMPSVMLPEVPVDVLLQALKMILTSYRDVSWLVDADGRIEAVFPDPDCPACGGQRPFSEGKYEIVTQVSCSDQSVALSPMVEEAIDLKQFQSKLSSYAKIVKSNAFFLEIEAEGHPMVIFRQGRAVVKLTKEKNTAFALYRRYLGC